MMVSLSPAAQYIRMSTDMQQYSLENQSAAIATYAARHGYTIIRTYEDAGRSGLRIDGRFALKGLIDDVTSGRTDFKTILVYDVSRWGRFQDTDESAYYEFLCRQAGISIEYCAEDFQNDGSLTATIIKNIKRAMAGEFSRELSVKVHAGQSRLAANGYHIGGAPGYGLRRFLLDEHGNQKMELKAGQHKSLHTERTILVPGPPEEVRVVREVYDLFIDQKATLVEIASKLNARGLLNGVGLAWKSANVRDLLSNEKYIGSSLYNRTSKKLGASWRRNPPGQWIRKRGAFEPIVSVEQFCRAQRQLRDNATAYTLNEMLDYLTATWCKSKHLTRAIIDSSPVSPTSITYIRHFGSTAKAFNAVGFRSETVIGRERLGLLRRQIVREIATHVPKYDGTVELVSSRTKCELRINNEMLVSVVLGRELQPFERYGRRQWRFAYRSKRKPDILIVARVEHAGGKILDYIILPFIFLPAGPWTMVQGVHYQRLESFRTDTLAPFYRLCARHTLASP
jgi:DNA invertase Pin-like site-specific DNA recombinase